MKKTETGRKNGKYIYQVVDSNGNVKAERISNKDYVACTSGGTYFFGRVDLIGKGEHGYMIRNTNCDRLRESITNIAYLIK